MKSAGWIPLAVLVTLLAMPLTTRADYAPSIVRDIWPGASGSTPSSMAAVGSTLFFAAADDDFGAELWKTDGTTAGTLLVRDIQPGPNFSNPGMLTAVGSTLFFVADDGVNGVELWSSDGTADGTVLVKDINPALATGCSPGNLTALDTTLYFTADDGLNGNELWKTDGTENGTVMVLDIHKRSHGSDPAYLTVMDGILYFQATDQLENSELWSSDGTEAGTVMVRDINPGADVGSSPVNLIALGSTLFFAADDGTNGGELWKSDGTEAGTVMVKDIALLPPYSSDPYELRVIASTLYFFAFDDLNSYGLWKSDGTEEGTVLVRDIDGTDYADFLTVAGSALYFRASDGTHGYELWKSDGTTAGTTMVKDINPAPDGENGSNPSFLTALGTTVYFSANDGTNGTELWKSNGTASGTLMVKDINGGTGDASPESLLALGPTLYFNATDGLHGVELWAVTPDDAPPTGTIIINNNKSATPSAQVTLSLNWDDGAGSGVVRMRFSDDGATWSAWETPVATRAYTLPDGDGYKTVRVQFLDKANNRSAVYNDYIRLDTVSPTGGIVINNGAITTTNLHVTLGLNWADVGSGVTRMRFSDNGSTWTTWESQKTTRAYTLPAGLGYHTVRVQYSDAASNYSPVYNDYIRLVP